MTLAAKWACLCFFLTGTLFSNYVFSQKKPTTQEIQKKVEELQKKAAEEEEMSDEEIEELAKQFGGDTKKGNASLAKPVSAPNPSRTLPGEVSKKSITGEAIITHVQGLQQKIISHLSKDELAVVNKSVEVAKGDAVLLGQLSVFVYYKGAQPQGLLLAMKAVLADRNNALNVNNLCALLTISGVAREAVPVLRGLVAAYPKDPMVLNNIGQAFASAGMKDSAMHYLNKCMAISPKHGQANTTAAKIAKANGNTAKAVEHAKTAMAEDPNLEAMAIIAENDKSGISFHYGKVGENIPDYFNMYKLRKPMHPTKVEMTAEAEAQKAAFLQKLAKLDEEITDISDEEREAGAEQVREDAKKISAAAWKAAAAGGGTVKAGYDPAAATALRLLATKYVQEIVPADLRKNEAKYNAAIKNELDALNADLARLSAKYKTELAKYYCGEGRGADCIKIDQLNKQWCREKDARYNLYMQACALAADDFDRKQILFSAEIFHYKEKLLRAAGVNQHLSNVGYYTAASEYLKNIEKIAGYPTFYPTCDTASRAALYSDTSSPAGKCPVKLEKKFGIFSVKLDCKNVNFTLNTPEIAEPFSLKFAYRYNYVKGQSTVAAILGAKKSLSTPSIPGVKGSVSGEGYEAIFISFGKDVTFDAGVRTGVKGSISATIGDQGYSGSRSLETSFGITSGYTQTGNLDGMTNDPGMESWF
ncbi:MAG: tetratricopeptide repeat protein [Pseudobacter sp.]|uniref:tetratricopeptide repeat protein n=1 Tax=Pseudobacter sp. TaxID=2045420 RepID=UPI003F7EC2C1